MTIELLAALTIGGWLVSMFAASAAQSLHLLAVHELEELGQRYQRRHAFEFIIDRREWLILGAESLRVLATVLAVTAGAYWYLLYSDDRSLSVAQWLTKVGLLSLVFLAGNSWIPYAIAQFASSTFIFHTWRVWWLVSFLAWPMIKGSEMVSGLFQRAVGAHDQVDDDEEWLEDEIRSMVSEGEREGLIESDERDMIEGVMELDEKDVFSVMTPRSKLDALDVNTPWDDAVRFVVTSGRTRIPVYDEQIDNMIGVLFAKDLLKESLQPNSKRRPLQQLVRQPLIVPESKMLDEMLQQFLQQRMHLALVLDEYGAVAGLVTIEDILEEIVGEIVDETDDEQPDDIIMLDPRRAVVGGSARIDRINERLALELPEDDDFDTVAGLLMKQLKSMPRVGMEVRLANVLFQVRQATRRSVEKVEISVLDTHVDDQNVEYSGADSVSAGDNP